MAALMTLWAMQPGIASAQTSGVGSDSFTRLFWRGTDSRISLWKLNSDLSFNSAREYGPYSEYIPLAIAVGNIPGAPGANSTYVLWRRTDGSIAIWIVDANLNYVTSNVYGPYAGWIAETVSIDDINRLRVVWRHTNGSISVWIVDTNLNYVTSNVYGPYFGYIPGPIGAAAVKSPLTPSTTGAHNGAADAAMNTPASSIPIPK